MAKIYFQKLSELVIEIKHFFSGAAVYINGSICVSWSPVGLVFKLSETEVDKLINSRDAIPLRYFPKGRVKKGYALFENPDEKKMSHWKKYFTLSAKQV